jgi:hypothetical protein
MTLGSEFTGELRAERLWECERLLLENHYRGSAKNLGVTGKGLAEALAELPQSQ